MPYCHGIILPITVVGGDCHAPPYHGGPALPTTAPPITVVGGTHHAPLMPQGQQPEWQ